LSCELRTLFLRTPARVFSYEANLDATRLVFSYRWHYGWRSRNHRFVA
jgi:hypothetical protein